jgi:hypothetical protein
MAKEIGTQIDAMSRLNAPKAECQCSCGWQGRSTFNYESNTISSEDVSEETRKYFQDCGNYIGACEGTGTSAATGILSGVAGIPDIPLHPELDDIKKKLLQTKIELQEKARELEQKEIQNDQKVQAERQHLRKTTEFLIEQHKDEIKNLQKDIVKVKNDAKVVIDFVRRKANKALDNEMEKRMNDKIMLSKHFEEKEAILKERFNLGLSKVDRQVKQALHNEKFFIRDDCNNALPSPPQPKTRSRRLPGCSKTNMRLPRARRREVSNESDDSFQGNILTDDSLSTRESQDIDFSNNREWFQERINELEEWTDTLTATLREGPSITETPVLDTFESAPASPPPLKRVSTRNEWGI